MLWLLLLAATASAENRKRVVVVASPQAEPALLRRFVLELTDLGLEPVLLSDAPLPNEPQAFATLAETHDTGAVVRVDSLAEGAILYFGANSRTPFQAVSGSADRREDLLVMRAVELIRAQLLELAPKPSEPVAPPPVVAELPAAPVPAPTEQGPLSLRLGGGVVSSERLVTSVHVEAAVRVALLPQLGLSVFGRAPIFAGKLLAAQGEGEVSVSPWFAGLALDLNVQLAEGWFLRPSAQIAYVYLRAQGKARAPFSGREQEFHTVAPGLELALAWSLSSSLALQLQTFGAVTPTRPIIVIAERSQTPWGQPLFGTTLSLAAQL